MRFLVQMCGLAVALILSGADVHQAFAQTPAETIQALGDLPSVADIRNIAGGEDGLERDARLDTAIIIVQEVARGAFMDPAVIEAGAQGFPDSYARNFEAYEREIKRVRAPYLAGGAQADSREAFDARRQELMADGAFLSSVASVMPPLLADRISRGQRQMASDKAAGEILQGGTVMDWVTAVLTGRIATDGQGQEFAALILALAVVGGVVTVGGVAFGLLPVLSAFRKPRVEAKGAGLRLHAMGRQWRVKVVDGAFQSDVHVQDRSYTAGGEQRVDVAGRLMSEWEETYTVRRAIESVAVIDGAGGTHALREDTYGLRGRSGDRVTCVLFQPAVSLIGGGPKLLTFRNHTRNDTKPGRWAYQRLARLPWLKLAMAAAALWGIGTLLVLLTLPAAGPGQLSSPQPNGLAAGLGGLLSLSPIALLVGLFVRKGDVERHIANHIAPDLLARGSSGASQRPDAKASAAVQPPPGFHWDGEDLVSNADPSVRIRPG